MNIVNLNNPFFNEMVLKKKEMLLCQIQLREF